MILLFFFLQKKLLTYTDVYISFVIHSKEESTVDSEHTEQTFRTETEKILKNDSICQIFTFIININALIQTEPPLNVHNIRINTIFE